MGFHSQVLSSGIFIQILFIPKNVQHSSCLFVIEQQKKKLKKNGKLNTRFSLTKIERDIEKK
jgi:hypothetical protein